MFSKKAFCNDYTYKAGREWVPREVMAGIFIDIRRFLGQNVLRVREGVGFQKGKQNRNKGENTKDSINQMRLKKKKGKVINELQKSSFF